jgi:hypothetical protein
VPERLAYWDFDFISAGGAKSSATEGLVIGKPISDFLPAKRREVK